MSALKLYNTMSRQKEEFTPLVPGQIGFYVCGPTVYNHIHIGNARTFISFDMIRRYLEYCGFAVTFVQNLTDVDDKIINRALAEGRSAAEVADDYSAAFLGAMEALGVAKPTIQPRATEEIAAMISLIERLIACGHAYAAGGDVYYAVRSFAAYGALSGRDIDQLQSGARIEVDERKRDPLDFTLWKAAKPGEPAWDSPWGLGRPGWHTECSAMSQRYLGETFDIHGGGDDLVFPHHENEIAQSRGCSNAGFARYWLHGGMLTIDSEKMSKSEGNFLLLKDVLEHVSPQALRLLMLQTHYRSPFDYSPDRLKEASTAFERVETALKNLDWALRGHAALSWGEGRSDGVPADAAEAAAAGGPGGAYAPRAKGAAVHGAANAPVDRAAGSQAAPAGVPPETGLSRHLRAEAAKTRAGFAEYMNDDFNTSGAVALLFALVSTLNNALASGLDTPADALAARAAGDLLVELLGVLGVDLHKAAEDAANAAALPAGLAGLAGSLLGYTGSDRTEAAGLLLEARSAARQAKDWPCADAIRAGLKELGLAIEDTASGPRLAKAEPPSGPDPAKG